VSENSDGIPEHRSARIQNVRTFKSRMQFTKEETKNLPKIAHTSKVVSFYTCPRAPFYRETKGLFIPKIPSELENIPSVNMYTNVFYIP
jgi:hypothetical protein